VGFFLHSIQTEAFYISNAQVMLSKVWLVFEIKETRMHASMAYVNGAGEKRRSRGSRKPVDNLALLNTLLAAPSAGSPAVDQRKPKNERQADEENKADSVSKPGGFANDPDDPKNPNEARERHQRKVRP
jgi:hypothetical protein